MNQKGVTLATVIVIIIVMIIIATVSLVAGNRLILNSKEYKEEQEIEMVRAAVLRKKSEVNMAGSLIPIGEAYVGNKNPIIKNDSDSTVVAKGWYLLNEESLEKLGIYDVSTRFLVHYDYEAVLSIKNPDYLEEYFAISYLHKLVDNGKVAGIKLENEINLDTSGDISGDNKIVRNKEENKMYGNGWYLLKPNNFESGDKNYIKHSYLFNFNTVAYRKITDEYEGINVDIAIED